MKNVIIVIQITHDDYYYRPHMTVAIIVQLCELFDPSYDLKLVILRNTVHSKPLSDHFIYTMDSSLSFTKMFSVGILVALLSLSVAEEPYAGCLTNYSVLEQAVLNTKDNRYNIIKSFYSPKSKYPSVYVTVT